MPEEKVSDDPNAQNQESESSKESKQDLPLLSSFSEEEEEEEEEEEVEEEDDNGSDDSDNDDSAYVDESDGESADDDSAETTVRMFNEVLDSKQTRKREEEDDRGYVYYEDLFDFPKDPEKWREEDLKELWADGPIEMTKPGWDPVWADEEDWEIVREEVKAGRDPPIAPFYLPFRRYYPAIPDNHFDISSPKSVIEEMDRIEEFMNWVSYIFPDGSSYEGTVWDDLAHGKGVYVAEQGLVRYEGEWLQNNMEGHGVVEVEIPDIEPVPGSKLEAKMRAEGKIISRDFMSPEDKRWLEMDIEDSIRLAGTKYEIPFYENEEWVRQFGKKPEKGRYRYAGQWKHGRMHGCGVYEVNERIIYGRFYFGEHLEDSTGCDADVSGLHAGIAEVAAAKARMFVNKPDGMVREERGPYGDPQHPYLYEEDDVWMAPGFINQFYEVPDYWKTYVREVDQEREMWLNSFYKAPLRIPMPAELEYWWATDKSPEFVLVNKEPEPNPEDPSKLIYSEDPLILHTPTGRFINFVEDEEHGVRLFWQPNLKDGEDVDPAKVEFLPLGYDEFFGRSVKGVKKESKLASFIAAVESACRPFFERLEKWTEEKKKESEMKLKLIEQELEFIEAELCLEEAMEDMEMELKMKQKEEEKKAVIDEKAEDALASLREDNMDSDQEEEEDEDEESPTSFGSVLEEGRVMGPDSMKDDKKGSKNGKSTFAATSMSFASCSLASVVPSILQESFVSWKKGRRLPAAIKLSDSCLEIPVGPLQTVQSVHFPCLFRPHATMRVAQEHRSFQKKNGRFSQLHSLAQILSGPGTSAQLKATSSVGKPAHHHKLHTNPEMNQHNILSMHVPLNPSDYCTANFT